MSCVVWAGGGDDMRIGDHHLWLLDIGASGHFTYDASQFRDYVECKRVLRCAGGNTYPMVGMGTLILCFRPEGGWYV